VSVLAPRASRCHHRRLLLLLSAPPPARAHLASARSDYQISSGGKTFYANVCGNTLQLHGCATASVAVMSDGTNCYPLQSDSIVFYSLLDDSQPEGGVHASFKPAMPANCHSGTAKKPYQLGMSFVCQPGQDTVLASVSPVRCGEAGARGGRGLTRGAARSSALTAATTC
jgi:hypothetical protein